MKTGSTHFAHLGRALHPRINSTKNRSMYAPDEQLHRIRHGLAHILAEAVRQLRPGSRLGFGPPIEDGFYYDFLLSSPISEEDFPAIEKRMRQLIEQDHPFIREDCAPDEAFARLEAMGEPYKREYARELLEKQNLAHLTFYQTGSFMDMCEGPHVARTRELPVQAFKLRNVAGAFWRGDSKNVMMTRIYAWAFATPAELKAHVAAFELAQSRDHKKLGKELELFVIDDAVGKGLPLWLPHGTILRDELEKLARALEFQAGFQRVATPHLARSELYYQTGHLPYYAPHMFPFMTIHPPEGTLGGPEEIYCLRPMNCPHHHRIFASRPRSYRELPLRLAEYGQVYRYEDSGALSGLLRVRGMCMNDAHIYCTAEQIQSEFLSVMRMHTQAYAILGLNDYHLRFSTWDPEDPKGQEKYINDPQAWDYSQKVIRRAMLESGLPFVEGKGEAAFYGPKIDFQLRTVTGREETASTNQLDFGIASRMDLKFTGADNQEHRPYIIHRAPLGTHERFIAFLVEHYGGAFPTWLAPVQIQLIAVNPKFLEYAKRLQDELRQHWIRAELDVSHESLGKQIRLAARRKIPNVIVLGERETLNKTVSWRRFGVDEQLTLPVAQFREVILDAIQRRLISPQLPSGSEAQAASPS